MNIWICIAGLLGLLSLQVAPPAVPPAGHSSPPLPQQILTLTSTDSTGADARGLWPLRNFASSEYAAQRGNASIGHAQNWATVQGPDGLVYAGNAEGVLVYDGVR